jgi:hypothetical protein
MPTVDCLDGTRRPESRSWTTGWAVASRPGSPFAILAPPESHSELLVDWLPAQRQTLDVRTARSEASVTPAFNRTDVDIRSPRVAYAEPDSGWHAHWASDGESDRPREVDPPD